MLKLAWVDDLDEAGVAAVRELLLAARKTDGRPEIEPGGALPGEFAGGQYLLGYDGDQLVGLAHVDTRGDAFGRTVAELVVPPDHRGGGHGTRLAEALVAAVPENLCVWSHGDHPAAARLAERFAFARARELLIMHATTAGADWPEPEPPKGVRLRTFVPGTDERAVVDVNARAFHWHPEQGGLTVDQLAATEAEDWFDPAGFFLAESADGRLVGFHWTKVHPPHRGGSASDRAGEPGGTGEPGEAGNAEPVGEVYVVGVDPAQQGGGLGRALTVAGLRHLRARGLSRVILYVEGDNSAAIAVYRRLGFIPYEIDVQYGSPATVA